MRHQNLSLMLGVCLGLWIAPAWGHQVKTNAEVGATIHFEPNDRPQAQTPTQVWFALTKKGGATIPLRDCNCQLKVRPLSGEATAQSFNLVAINAESYRDIPSGTVTFPQAGIYTVELTGQPMKAGAFQPFRLSFKTTVTPLIGSSTNAGSPQASRVSSSPKTGGNSQSGSLNVLYLACGAGLLSCLLVFKK